MRDLILFLVLIFVTSCSSTSNKAKQDTVVIDFYPQGNYELFNKVNKALHSMKSFKEGYYFNNPEGNNCIGTCRTIFILWKDLKNSERPKVEISQNDSKDKSKKVLYFKSDRPEDMADELKNEILKFKSKRLL